MTSPEPLRDPAALAGSALFALLLSAGLATLLPPVAVGMTALLAFLMAMITLSDLRHFIIPDVLSLPAIPLGLLASALLAPAGEWPHAIVTSSAAAAGAALVFFLLREAYWRLRGVEGLGLGDVKIAAVAGAWLGPEPLASAALVAAVAATLATLLASLRRNGGMLHRQLQVPFGAFIAPTILAFWLWHVTAAAAVN